MGARIGPRQDEHLYDVPNVDLAQRVTGIEPERVSGHPFLKDAGFRSLQRLVLADVNGGIVVGLLPGELTANARFLYSDGRAQTFVRKAEEGGWQVDPNPHIGFWQAPVRQRLYLETKLDPMSYVALWQDPKDRHFGGYWPDELARSVWPWLKDQRLATPADDPVFGEFLLLLNKQKRQAHLRAGLRANRNWSREDVAATTASQLALEVRDAVNALLGAIGEPAFPIG